MVDGCSHLQLLRHILVPLTIPSKIVAFCSFLLSRNEVLFASVLTSSAPTTLGVGLPGYLAADEVGDQVFRSQRMSAGIVSGPTHGAATGSHLHRLIAYPLVTEGMAG